MQWLNLFKIDAYQYARRVKGSSGYWFRKLLFCDLLTEMLGHRHGQQYWTSCNVPHLVITFCWVQHIAYYALLVQLLRSTKWLSILQSMLQYIYVASSDIQVAIGTLVPCPFLLTERNTLLRAPLCSMPYMVISWTALWKYKLKLR